MPPFYRIAEVALFAALTFIPHLIIALYAFKNRLRYNKTTTFLLVSIITLIQVSLGTASLLSKLHMGIVSIAGSVIYVLLYFLLVKAHFGKLFFMVLMLTNTLHFTIIGGKCLEGLIFGVDTASQLYTWQSSLFLLITHLFTTLPFFFYIRTYFCNAINKQYGKAAWGYLWLIPATFYWIWFHHLYADNETALEVALNIRNTIFLLFIDLGSILIYHTVLHMLLAQDANLKLQQYNSQLEMQNLQYGNLQNKINEARQAKHDIRHHITIMNSYLQNGEYDKLAKYLNSYKKSLPDDSKIVFCKHYAINTLLLYFAQQAKNHDIDFDVVIADISEDINIPDNILSVVLGNLLENAIEACQHVSNKPRKITIRSKEADGNLFFKIENTYNGNIKRDQNGLYMSTKHEGRGLGLKSVRSIIKQYDGIVEIEHTDDIFSVSVFSAIPKL